ncbi:MAG: SDR family oxidoreductase [Fastidiosipila sp.]|nr:SDR family oxidoreductase [Fastidiosipila sp.]
MPISFDIKDKTAVITGGGGVILSVLAKEFAKLGVRVAVLDLKVEAAQRVVDEIKHNGGEAIAVEADVLNKESLENACKTVVGRFGCVDILINGAGGNHPKATCSAERSFFALEADAIRAVFDLNVTGAILTTQAFGQEIIKRGKGNVINIASMASYLPLTNTVAYSAAKAAVANFTQWMAIHFNQVYSEEIRVNAIAPGFLLTEQNRFLMQTEDGRLTDRGARVIQKTPMARFGEPEEMVGAVVWLCSDAASFVNGAVVPIDGGFSAYWGV